MPLSQKDDEFIEDYITAADWHNKIEIKYILPDIKINNAKKILKIGASGFRYAMEIAKQNPEIEVHIADYPNMLHVAEKLLHKECDSNNIKFIDNTSIQDYFNRYYDIIFLDSMIEEYSVIENIQRLTNLYKILNKGGRLIINQQLVSDCRTQPLYSTLKSITLLLNTPAGNAYTFSDI